jgi:RNA polymerase primary sigma factor
MKSKVTITNKLTIVDNLSISRYLNELASDKMTTPLSKEREPAMFIEYHSMQAGPQREAIKERIIKSNLRFVITVAKQYEYDKLMLVDAINEGNIGLLVAFEKFDHTKGVRFITYATWHVRQHIQRFVDEVLADIVQPANRDRIKRRMKVARRMLNDAGFENPTDEQLVEKYMEIKETAEPVLTAAAYSHMKNESNGFVSVNTPTGDRYGRNPDEQMVIGDNYQSDTVYRADNVIATEDKNSLLNAVLSKLTDRERLIVEHTFGFNGKEERTIDQLAETLGFTRERIGQLLNKALKFLKENHKKEVFELGRGVDYKVSADYRTW